MGTGKGDLIRESYQTYYSSGYYDQRYPTPNQATFKAILAHLNKDDHVIDYGCGSGRYLLHLQGLCAVAAGYDISETAIGLLRSRAAKQGWHDLAILGPNPEMLETHIKQEGQADLVLCLFGVLGHIDNRDGRLAALRQMRALLKPGVGRLLISVPNIARRFHREQRQGADGLIQYSRLVDGDDMTLRYQLFDTARLTSELAEAGFDTHTMRAESVLPENWLSKSAPLRWIDGLLTPLCPARWGYGIIAEAIA